ncbi:MAG: lysophospholipid acyltransferase family protein [Actinomycetota bacterium]
MGDPVYRVVVGAAKGMIKTMGWRVIVDGAENIPREGPAVIATNHIGYLDFVFSGYAARDQKRLVRFLSKKEIFDKGGVGWLMRKMKHIPVDRFGAPRESFDAAVAALRRGEVVGMFPEATISPSFVPRAGKNGAVRMAQAANAPLIPAAVWGTHRILTKWRPKNFKRGIAIMVNVGKPLHLEASDDPDEATGRLMLAINELLADAQARYPQQPASDEDRWWLPAHLGGTAPTPEEAEVRLAAEREGRKRERDAD